MKYYFSKTLSIPFDDAVVGVTEELKKEGFGILTEIDVKETLKKKLDVDFKKYKILGPATLLLLIERCRTKTKSGPCCHAMSWYRKLKRAR